MHKCLWKKKKENKLVIHKTTKIRKNPGNII